MCHLAVQAAFTRHGGKVRDITFQQFINFSIDESPDRLAPWRRFQPFSPTVRTHAAAPVQGHIEIQDAIGYRQLRADWKRTGCQS
jgi:hypothetical protein